VAEYLVVERRVSMPPEKVFTYFTDADKWRVWQGTEAEIDLVPGGVWRVNVTGDGFASGRVVEVVPNERVVFTWGWEHGPPAPPGSTTVAIELIPEGKGDADPPHSLRPSAGSDRDTSPRLGALRAASGRSL
jgi:uncharacterized protein YndB with AHSA1/START domain